MFNERVLRGNTYAILKNVNRNIDPNIKPPMIKKNIKIQQEVLILIKENQHNIIK